MFSVTGPELHPDAPPTAATSQDDDPGRSSDPLLSRVADAAAQLAGIAELPSAEAVTRFDAMHSELQAALAELDEG